MATDDLNREIHTRLRRQEMPPYTTDLATAWRLVEQLAAQGWWVTIRHEVPNPDRQPGYLVEFRDVRLQPGPQQPPCTAWALRLPEAICLAALHVADIIELPFAEKMPKDTP